LNRVGTFELTVVKVAVNAMFFGAILHSLDFGSANGGIVVLVL